MTVEIIECEQNSQEWMMARLGLATASAFSDVLSKGEGKTRAAYARRVAAEIITGELIESFSNGYMERGHLQEDEARQMYAFMTDCDPKRVGFIRNGRVGCSPDALIGDDGVLEIKTQRADLLIETIRKDVFPAAHVAQCQGALWITERQWVDIVVYAPRMPLFIRRAHRDPVYIAALAKAVCEFSVEVDAMVEAIRRYGAQPIAGAAQ